MIEPVIHITYLQCSRILTGFGNENNDHALKINYISMG